MALGDRQRAWRLGVAGLVRQTVRWRHGATRRHDPSLQTTVANCLEIRDDVIESRALRRPFLDAPEGKLREIFQLRIRPTCHKIEPGEEAFASFGCRRLNGLEYGIHDIASGSHSGRQLVQEQLQEHHTEGVRLRLLSNLPGPDVFGAHVPGGAADVVDIEAALPSVLDNTRQAKISDLRDSVRGQKDVRGFDISMKCFRLAVHHVSQAAGRVECHAQALLPREPSSSQLALVQQPPDVAPGQQLVHKKLFVSVASVLAPADEGDEVRVL
mmetsp:Transcript_3855/g.9827  ORF Transcript_3855/g.9827 Transcript_3855/m.9827 type:complete len:270 (+) Transcript_3855:1119-1928(+)